MTTPTSFNTVDRIIRFAMEDAGLLQDGDEPDSEQYAKNILRLSDLFNVLQVRPGLKLWLNSIQSITLTASLATYTLGPGGSIITTKPTRVLQGWFVDSSSVARPLEALSYTEYNKLSDPTQTGAITSYFADKQQSNIVVKFWLVPDATAATGTVKLLLQTQVTQPVSLNDSMNFPNEWFMALRWALAADLCTGQPDQIVAMCERKAETYLRLLEDWDVEDADTRFQPDLRALGGSSRFA